jgi:hypothetical protein
MLVVDAAKPRPRVDSRRGEFNPVNWAAAVRAFGAYQRSL